MSGADFGVLIIVGVIASTIVEFIKSNIPSKSLKMLTVAGLSLVFGTIYYFVRDTAYWQTAVTILMTAGAVYAYFWKHVETK
jgi:intracellular septation protein A